MADDKKPNVAPPPPPPPRPAKPSASPPSVAAAQTLQAGTDASIEASKARTVNLGSAPVSLPDPLLGATVAGRYKVLKKLGEGGMGTVYLALHTVLEKQLALKVLHNEFARKPELVERFIQEAKAASRIRHQNVIDISDFGASDEGHVFFAMELLEGHDLHEEIARARREGKLLPWERTKKIFLQVCSALSAAHARNIVHRDLKPENVYIIEQHGDPDFVKLLDFGIAKMTDVSSSEAGRKLTKTGMLFGTPEYMSPEQARGDSVDQRADIYAMGVMLFLLVSNRLPFHADNFMGILSQHLTEEPPEIAPETFDQIGAPRELAEVIDRALVKDREERWQTIDELVAAICDICGDPLPSDRSRPNRAPSVPSPGETTRMRTPTDQALRGRPSGRSKPPTIDPDAAPKARTRVVTGPHSARRAKPETDAPDPEWTRNAPEVPVAIDHGPVPAPKQRGLAAAAIVGVLLLGAAGAGIYMFALRDKDPEPSAVADGSGSAGSANTPPNTPPPSPPPSSLPANAEVVIDSTPQGAKVIELPSNTAVGKTPHRLTLAGSATPRRYKLVLKGYSDLTVDVVPDKAKVALKPELVKAGTARVDTPPSTPTTTITKPDTSTAVTRPDTSTAVTKPDTSAPETKPDTTPPPPPEPKPEQPPPPEPRPEPTPEPPATE